MYKLKGFAIRFERQVVAMSVLLISLSIALVYTSAAWAESENIALKVQQMIEDGELSQAENLLTQADSAQLSDFQRGYLQGWLLIKQQKNEQALQSWKTLRQQYPHSLELGNNLAVLLMQKKQFDEAQRILEQTLNADRQISKALENLNKLYSYQAQQSYNNVFRRIEPSVPQGAWLALTETSDVKVIESEFDQQEQVLHALETWRQAWSDQNFQRYLAAYHPDFVPAQGQSQQAWRNARQRSLTNPRFIEVHLSNVVLTPLADDLVRIQFNQRYRSDRFQDEVIKVILMQQDGQLWKIMQEIVTHEK